MSRMEIMCKFIKLVFILPFAAGGYLAVWSEMDGVVRAFMLATFGPLLLAVGGDEFIGFLRAIGDVKRNETNG